MSKKRKNKETNQETNLEIVESPKKEENEEMTEEKIGIFKKIRRGIKGFFTSKAGKVVGITTIVVAGVTAAGVTIYKVFFEDGHEELIEETDLENLTEELDEDESDEDEDDSSNDEEN